MFFTGSGPDKVPEHSDLILRSHSASSIEGFLSTTVVIHLRSGQPSSFKFTVCDASGVWTCVGDGFG
jgi:hypothetical protein